MVKSLSFSRETKHELARIFPEKKCCRLAELAGLIRLKGTMCFNEQQTLGLLVTTESAPIARKIFSLWKELYQVEPKISMHRRKKLQKKIVYGVYSYSLPDKMLKELGLLNREGKFTMGIRKKLISKKCCQRSYLRGVFLAAGSISNPDNNYHLEMITNYYRYAQALVKVINRFPEMAARISTRQKRYLIYFKESEQIAGFLNIIGAHQALLKFENIRIMKDVRNQVNRLVNCDTANLKKVVNAALKQIEQIKFIEQTIGLDKLPPRLQEVAYLRLHNPDSSLRELGELLNPPLSKSGINHRLRKIEELARKINLQTGEKNKKD